MATLTLRRTATAQWDPSSGTGTLSTESGALDAPFDTASRFERGDGTNPEELLAAAHAACFSMALTQLVEEAGYEPDNVATDATVELEADGTPRIARVHLSTRGRADDVDEESLRELARRAKDECPVSGALGAVPIDVDASLETPTPG